MKSITFKTVSASLVLTISLFGTSSAFSDKQKITIGGSSPVGLYTVAARALCRVVNRHDANVDCSNKLSGGSVSNLNDLGKGEIQLGIAQSDAQFYAYTGEGDKSFRDKEKMTNLRSVFSMYPEAFTIIARKDSGIAELNDLVGKKVNIGNPGSGQRATMETVMATKGWTKKSFLIAEELPSNEHALALCHDKVQALIFSTGHPNPSVGHAVGLCDAVVVTAIDEDISKLVEAKPFYEQVNVPGGIYASNDDSVNSFGVLATLVTTSDVSNDLVYNFVKTMFENLDDFKRAHPAFGYIEPAKMLKDGLTAPLHDGAVRYYKEKGWM